MGDITGLDDYPLSGKCGSPGGAIVDDRGALKISHFVNAALPIYNLP